MSFTAAVRALDEEERLKREAAEAPARPSFDYGDIGGELQRRFGWLGEERGPFGMPRRLSAGPLSVPNPLAAPIDAVGVAGTTLDLISDAAIKPLVSPPLVAARALATPSAMALRAARDIAQSSSFSPLHALGGIPAAGADLLGRDPTLGEVVNPSAAAGYMDEQARRDWVRGLAWGIATDPTNLIPGVGLVGAVGKPLLRGARVASTAIKAGEAVGLGGRVAARAEPFLARAVSVDEAAEQVLGRAYKALGGGIGAGARAGFGELEAGLPTITEHLPGAVARPLGAGAEFAGRGLRYAGTQSDLARRTIGVSNIQSALRAVAQQAGARGVPLDKILFGPSVAGVVGKTIWDEVARGYTRMFDTASALDEPITQVAGMDVIRQYQEQRQHIEAAFATQREELWNRTDPHWVANEAPEGLGQLLEPDARKMTEENFAQQAALITGLQRDAQQSLERLTALTPEQMALKGDWAIDEAQRTRVTDTFRAAIEDIDTSGRQAAQQARILGGYAEKETGRWVPGIFDDEAEVRAGVDTIYRVNREQAIEKTRSTIASITSEFDDELRSGDIAGLAKMAGEQFGAHFANTRAETQPMSAWLDQLAPQHKRTLTDQDSLSLLRESSRALMLDRRYIRRIFEQEVRPKLINIDKVGQDQADAMLDQMLGSKEHVRSNMALYDVRPEIATKVEQRLAKYEGTGDLMSGDGTMGLVSQEMIRRRMGAGEERLLKPWLGPLLTAAGMWRESALVSVGYHVANLASGLALAYHGNVSPADILTQTTRNLQDYVQSGAAWESLKTGAVWNPPLHRNTMPEYLSIRDDLPQAIRRSIGEPTNALPGIVGRTGPQSAFARVPWQARAGVGGVLGVASAMSADPDDRPLNALAVGALGAATLGGMPRIVGLNRSVANAVEDALHTTVFNTRFKEYLPAAKQAFFEQIDERLAAAAIQDTVGRPLSNAARLPGLNDIQSLGDMIAAQREGGLRIDMAGPTTPVVRDPRGWTVNQVERQQFDPIAGPVPEPPQTPPGPRATLTPPPVDTGGSPAWQRRPINAGIPADLAAARAAHIDQARATVEAEVANYRGAPPAPPGWSPEREAAVGTHFDEKVAFAQKAEITGEAIRSDLARAFPDARVEQAGSLASGRFFDKGVRAHDYDYHIEGLDLPPSAGKDTVPLTPEIKTALQKVARARTGETVDVFVTHEGNLWVIDRGRLSRKPGAFGKERRLGPGGIVITGRDTPWPEFEQQFYADMGRSPHAAAPAAPSTAGPSAAAPAPVIPHSDRIKPEVVAQALAALPEAIRADVARRVARIGVRDFGGDGGKFVMGNPGKPGTVFVEPDQVDNVRTIAHELLHAHTFEADFSQDFLNRWVEARYPEGDLAAMKERIAKGHGFHAFGYNGNEDLTVGIERYLFEPENLSDAQRAVLGEYLDSLAGPAATAPIEGPLLAETVDPAGRPPDLGLAASPTTPGFRAEQTVPLNEELKKFWLSRNGNVKPDEIHTFILKKGGTTGQADALSSGWWEDSEGAIAPAVADNTGINFDYSDVPNITEWLRRSQVVPFVTWTSKALPVYAAILMQHPQYIWAIDQLNDLSEEDIQEAGLTERWAGLARQGMLGSMVADLALGKNGSMLAQPWKLIFPYADLGVREPNEDDTLIDQLMTVLQPLGLTPGPAVTMPLEALGAISDRPFGLFRPSSYIEAIGGAIEGRPIDFEAPSTALQRASRAALGADDQESVSGLHPAVEWAIRNRIAEIAFEETGGPAKGQYLVAMDDPTSGIWRRAAAEIARERGVQTAIGSLAPIRPKFLSQTEERIRAREQAQGVAPPQLAEVRNRPITDEERLIAERSLKKAPLRRGKTLDDRVRELRTQALRNVANKRDPATEAFRYTSGAEGTSISRGFQALAEFRKTIRGLPFPEQQRLLGEFYDTRPDLMEAQLTQTASRG